MSGVTWGNNTVHTIGGAPAPSAFGAPAPAFGAPAPTPATGGFGFGASPAKPPMGGGSLFGAPAPASGGFGSLGQPQKPQMPQHHIPAQAAMQVSEGWIFVKGFFLFLLRYASPPFVSIGFKSDAVIVLFEFSSYQQRLSFSGEDDRRKGG
mmetsp:Transcript_9885/g.20728  ORF Transcript_9885/g.20728 Transcript_9885/m.20728 type:complete len:151 (+) Transcript_9885:343-795(+)